MNEKEIEISSGTLNRECFFSEINHLVNFLKSFEIEGVKVAWGWGCKMDLDSLWAYSEIHVVDLPSFILKGVDEGIFTPNECDFFIASLEGRFEFKFCHESDIHFVTSDPKMAELVEDSWRKRNMLGYTKTHEGWKPMFQ